MSLLPLRRANIAPGPGRATGVDPPHGLLGLQASGTQATGPPRLDGQPATPSVDLDVASDQSARPVRVGASRDAKLVPHRPGVAAVVDFNAEGLRGGGAHFAVDDCGHARELGVLGSQTASPGSNDQLVEGYGLYAHARRLVVVLKVPRRRPTALRLHYEAEVGLRLGVGQARNQS